MDVLYCLVALIAGACAPTQAGVNSELRIWTGDPVLAAMISFAVGTAALFLYITLFRIPWPQLGTAVELPWWMWTGGLLGAFLVAVTVIVAPKLGAATTMGFMVLGQMLAGLALDNYGLVGFADHPLSFWRVVGACMVVGGAILIKKF
jgi:bacterial/archaeal transporter family-2 protein